MSLKTDREKTAHLLRRFAFGASEAELDYYCKDGLSGAIGLLLDCENTPEVVDHPVEVFETGKQQLRPQGVQAWWMTKMLTTRRPLLEKMTLFWHDHFATSAEKVTNGPLLHQQNELIRANSLSSFRQLLHAVSKDPAMLVWLDNQYNVKGKPNENFAREVMELFTLGIGNYSEKDVQEAARAFTGWTFRGADREKLARYRKSEFFFDKRKHDDGEKDVLGSRGPWDGDDVLNILCDESQTARYLTHKIWTWFVYQNPDPALVDRLATDWKKSGLQIKSLLRAIMTAPEFYSEKAERKLYKTPIDFVVPTLRQLGIGETLTNVKPNAEGILPRAQIAPVFGLLLSAKQMGMQILFPPDVSGWDGGPSWISSATMLERIKWADRVFGTAPASRGAVNLRYAMYPLLSGDPTPAGVVRTLLSIFDAQLSTTKTPSLVVAAEKAMNGKLTPQNANQVAAAVSRLIFGSPEFQFA